MGWIQRISKRHTWVIIVSINHGISIQRVGRNIVIRNYETRKRRIWENIFLSEIIGLEYDVFGRIFSERNMVLFDAFWAVLLA